MRSTGWDKWKVFCLGLADEVGIDYVTPVPLDVWVAGIVRPHVEIHDHFDEHWMRPLVSREAVLDAVRLADALFRLGDKRERGKRFGGCLRVG